ncbi:MAG TPA: hypothetical protein PKD99_05475 [Sphingopyxis sp.]|nr:hypothetical protein [Sphingopyxis sp.]HMP44537.1 hypothetical protein [Sphingopyxis sp.]
MSQLQQVHDLVHRIWQQPALRARFAQDPAAVLAQEPLTDGQRALLLKGDFEALGELGMHPLAQMVYSLARTPEMAGMISFTDYLADLEEAANG